MEGIIAQNICHSYRQAGTKPVVVLDDVSLCLSPGECVALTGESGSGKSTIARLLLGFEKPRDGRILLDGMDVTTWSARRWRQYRPRIQAVFQDAAGTLNPQRTVYRNMEEGLINLTSLDAAARKKEIFGLMERFHMPQRLLKTPTRQLSGGEQRRASLVRALALRPKYLVLDEVTSGLDAISAKAVLDTLQSYQAGFGCAYLFITHDQDCACRMADRIVHMQKGRLVREGVKLNRKEASPVVTGENAKENV